VLRRTLGAGGLGCPALTLDEWLTIGHPRESVETA
jgi:hypothetical protein